MSSCHTHGDPCCTQCVPGILFPLPDVPAAIGYLKRKDGERGYRVVGMCCATDVDKGHASKVYRLNIIPYMQHCCECNRTLVTGGSMRDLFDGTV